MAHWYVKAASPVGTGTGRALWTVNTAYTIGDRVICSWGYGTVARRRYVYECTTGGTSHGTTEPVWPVSGTVNDNGVVWTTREPTSWANATLFLDYFMSITTTTWAAGDRFWVDSSIVVEYGGTLYIGQTTYNPGSYTVPTYITSTSDLTHEPPTSRAVGAKFRFAGHFDPRSSGMYFYGCIFEVGYGSTSGTPRFYTVPNNADNFSGITFEDCKIKLAYAVTGCYVYLGCGSSVYYSSDTKLINTDIEFTHAGQGIIFNHGRSEILGGSVIGTSPTTVFYGATNYFGGLASVVGVDLSTASSNLIDVTNMYSLSVLISRCKLNSSVNMFTGTYIGRRGANIVVELCSAGTANYKMAVYDFAGTVVDEKTFIRVDGASDGTTPIAWKMVSNANNCFFALRTPQIAIWIDDVGSAKTLTVEILHDSVTALKDTEIWLEVTALTDASFPQASLTTDKGIPTFGGINQASSSATWYTVGMANPNRQQLSVNVTPQLKGYVTVRVAFAKVNSTIYVDPKVVITS